MVVEVLRSCHSSQWRFFANAPTAITRGRFYWSADGAPALPYFHDFYSATWTAGDIQSPTRTGPVQSAQRTWNNGALDVQRPPSVPVGTDGDFSEQLFFPADENKFTLRAGITDRCWVNVNAPFLDLDTVSNIKSCCVRNVYARIIELLYLHDTARIDAFFLKWLGPGATVTHYAEAGDFPQFCIVQNSDYVMLFVSGTTSFQQLALQAFQSYLGPTQFGKVATLKLWNDLSIKLSNALLEVGVVEETPLICVGHSYGAAGLVPLVIRAADFRPLRKIFFLSFGMPRATDAKGVAIVGRNANRVQDPLQTLHVLNQGDIVPQVPLSVQQCDWFPSLISLALRKLWGEWKPNADYLIQTPTGGKAISHLPNLAADVVTSLLSQLIAQGELNPIQPHTIGEYIRRGCLGCNCPAWPFSAASWGEIFGGRCGGNVIRLRAEVPFLCGCCNGIAPAEVFNAVVSGLETAGYPGGEFVLASPIENPTCVWVNHFFGADGAHGSLELDLSLAEPILTFRYQPYPPNVWDFGQFLWSGRAYSRRCAPFGAKFVFVPDVWPPGAPAPELFDHTVTVLIGETASIGEPARFRMGSYLVNDVSPEVLADNYLLLSSNVLPGVPEAPVEAKLRLRASILERTPRAGFSVAFIESDGNYGACPPFDCLSSSSAFTMLYWAKRTGGANTLWVGQTKNNTSKRTDCVVYVDGTLDAVVSDSGGLTYGAGTDAGTGVWHSYVFRFDGTQSDNDTRLRAWRDGIEVALTYVGTIPSITDTDDADFEIGRKQATGEMSEAKMCQLAIFDVALSVNEIESLGIGWGNPVALGAVSYYQFTEGTDVYLSDVNGGDDIVLTDDTHWDTDLPAELT